jgi:hypothetical protein
VRVLALALAAGVLLVPAATAGPRGPSGCPREASLGTVNFPRGGKEHSVSLATCVDRVVAKIEPSPQPAVKGVVVRGHALWVRRNGSLVRLTPELRGPEGLQAFPEPLSLSPDGKFVLWVRAVNSSSMAADGLPLKITPLAGGRTREIGVFLATRDYWSWCGSTLVVTLGGNRIATTNKRLAVARAPGWKPRLLWRDRTRAFGSVACAPGGTSLVVLSQPASTNAYFFSTRWRLWRIGLDGSRRLLDAPPTGWADESPQWSRDGRSLLFVRERDGFGSLMLWQAGRATGPFANLGYSLGYYGHHAWPLVWSVGAR